MSGVLTKITTMTKRRIVTLASAVALLGFVGGAYAQTPSDTQYRGGGVAGAGGSGGEQAGGSLPFTGFDAMIVALGGAGLAATGVVLRRTARAKRR